LSVAQHAAGNGPHGRHLFTLSLTALGVVYGDIGTSPLYAIKECFTGVHGVSPTPDNVLGVLSLVFWSLILVISVKYLGVVMRADNRGEGGILALMALVRPAHHDTSPRRRWAIVLLGLFGASLLYGDGMITPAISVLGAMEGLQVATPALASYVVPITIAILLVLFIFQHHGTGSVGSVFGPVMLLWFFAIGILGIVEIARQPAVLGAVDPVDGVRFFAQNHWYGVLVLGSVFLVVTGGEALYADMGHFGTRPIRAAWFSLVLPGLLLNYFGQGALLLRHPGAAQNPFYLLAPSWLLYPLIVLATAAAIIASQAVISGAFSLSRQAVQLGFSPRLTIEHTSSEEAGQIYVPEVNWALALATIALVLGFQSATNLAGAYGVAVTSTMVITTLLLYVVAREQWHWSLPAAALLSAFFLSFDLAFFGANLVKIPHGGWFPLVIAAIVYTLMATWQRGRELLYGRLRERAVPLDILLGDIKADPPIRVPGTAVFMTPNPGATPPALVHNLTHNKVLHEQVVFLTILTEEVPVVLPEDRVHSENLGDGFYWVTARYGFMQDPSVPDILERVGAFGLEVRLEATTFFLGRETLLATERPGMARWREAVFSFMSRNALRATAFFKIPPDQVFEVGVQVEM
jgi:KUP system potassium uptake protein